MPDFGDLAGFTPQQAAAIRATGSVLVVAGAGTGKTRTLVERCVQNVLHTSVGLDQILMVTFTDAAALEMRTRIRERLEQAQEQDPRNGRLSEQLALLENASICTLHSFCLQLVREHFYELEIDPQITVLSEQQRRVLQEETLNAILAEAYTGDHSHAEEICALVRLLSNPGDWKVRELIYELHEYTQTRPDPEAWFTRELTKLERPNPELLLHLLAEAVRKLCQSWRPLLQASPADCAPLRACAQALDKLQSCDSRQALAAALHRIQQIDAGKWKLGTKKFRNDVKEFFQDVEFLSSISAVEKTDPLVQDWEWTAPTVRTLLLLAQEFASRFASAKRTMGGVDFHDLEQFSLRLLWQEQKPTQLARDWQTKLELIFVDEYQDINPAQDQILRALSRSGAGMNRFLVGDVKQSIYGFRQAEPEIFLQYAKEWKRSSASVESGKSSGTSYHLSDNFRSRERLLDFINSLFGQLLQPDFGGIKYDTEAELRFGDRGERQHLARNSDPQPRTEFILCLPDRKEVDDDDRTNAEREARVIALRLRQLRESGQEIWDEEAKAFRKVEWYDIVILLRAASGKVEAYAKEFDTAGIPLLASGGALFEALEVQDLLNVLLVLDNPLQDRPLIAVLRSPLGGLSLDDLAQVRLAKRRIPFWNALKLWHAASRAKEPTPTFEKVNAFLDRFHRWRAMARCSSLTQRLERILEETNYLDWLLTQSRCEQRRANVQQLLSLTREFDDLHRENLFGFLQFLQSEQEAGADREPPPIAATDAVRLMTIHKSKGLEFPIVVLPDLSKDFNTGDARGEIITDGELGICPKVHAPQTGQSYPSLPFWLAKKKLNARTLAEEMRLLYVAMTRAQEMLILSATCSDNQARRWAERADDFTQPCRLRRARRCLDWLGPWFTASAPSGWLDQPEGSAQHWRWRIIRDFSSNESSTREPVSSESATLTRAEFDALQAQLTWRYGHAEATAQPAKTSVTALRRETAEELELATPFKMARLSKPRGDSELDATEIGLAHHQFLQWVDLARMSDADYLTLESKRLVSCGLLSKDQAAALDLAAIARFWDCDIGRQILRHKDKVQREIPFTVRLTRESDPSISLLNRIPDGEFIVVQGAIDLAVLLPGEIWIVDFKTDQIAENELTERTAEYAVQLRLYAIALSEVYRRPVTRCWLHFLHLGRTIQI